MKRNGWKRANECVDGGYCFEKRRDEVRKREDRERERRRTTEWYYRVRRNEAGEGRADEGRLRSRKKRSRLHRRNIGDI